MSLCGDYYYTPGEPWNNYVREQNDDGYKYFSSVTAEAAAAAVPFWMASTER